MQAGYNILCTYVCHTAQACIYCGSQESDRQTTDNRTTPTGTMAHTLYSSPLRHECRAGAQGLNSPHASLSWSAGSQA